MSDKPKGPAFTRKMAIVSGIVTVMVLAAVILLISAFGAPRAQVAQDSVKAESAQLARQAEAALRSGDATEAAKLAEKAIGLDPANESAAKVARQAAAARSGKQPDSAESSPLKKKSKKKVSQGSQSPDSSNSSSGEPNDDDDSSSLDGASFNTKVKNQSALLPRSFPDYEMGDSAVRGGEAQVAGTAAVSKAGAKQVIWAVHEMKDPAEAEAFIDNASKNLYGENSGTVDVDGVSAYAGTDGGHTATIAYTRGIYVFEVLVSCDSDPSQYFDLAVAAAKAFSDHAE